MSVTSRWLILLVEKTEETGVKRRAAAVTMINVIPIFVYIHGR
jgi:hypothetical protein